MINLIHEPEMSADDIKQILLNMEIIADNGKIVMGYFSYHEFVYDIYSSELPEYRIDEVCARIKRFWDNPIEVLVDGYHPSHEWRMEKDKPLLRFEAILELRDGGQVWETVTVVRTGESAFKASKTHSIGTYGTTKRNF